MGWFGDGRGRVGQGGLGASCIRSHLLNLMPPIVNVRIGNGDVNVLVGRGDEGEGGDQSADYECNVRSDLCAACLAGICGGQ